MSAPAVMASPLRFYHQAPSPANSGNRPARAANPEFEIYDIQENPAQGKLVRVSYDGAERKLVFSMYPQLGPRKTDPNDPSPQFDYARRSVVRFRPTEWAAMLAVIEGKMEKSDWKPTKAHQMEFSPSEDGTYALRGDVHRLNVDSVKWDINFSKTHVTMLYRFLDSALNASFEFNRAGAAANNVIGSGNNTQAGGRGGGYRNDRQQQRRQQ